MPDQFWRLSLAEFNMLCISHNKIEREGRYCAWLSGRCNAKALTKDGLEDFNKLFPEDTAPPTKSRTERWIDECKMAGLKAGGLTI